MNDKKTITADTIGLGKDIVTLIRDFLILIFAVLLLVFPPTFNTILVNAGFEEGSFIGMKWKKGFNKNDQALKEALLTIDELRAQLKKTSNALGDSTSTSLNAKGIDSIKNINSRLENASLRLMSSVRRTISSTSSLAENAQKEVSSYSTWGIIYATDVSLKAAEYEATVIARKNILPNPKIFLKNGLYHTISIVADKEDAKEVLKRAKKRRTDAYILPMEGWCRNAEDKKGYTECSTNE